MTLAGGAVKEGDAAQAGHVLEVLLESLPASEAARLAARITGMPRNALCKLALGRAK